MTEIVIYGIGDMAEIAHYYLQNDSEHNVVAFCINQSALPQEKYFKELPVVSFD